MVWWWIIPALAGALAAILLLAGLAALMRRRMYRALGGIFSGGMILAAAVAVVLLGLDIQTYRRLTYERPIATIDLRQIGDHRFEATIGQPPGSGQPQTYLLQGDEWRIEARVLKWKPWANVLGLDSRYRLVRLAGEFADTQSELSAPRSAYDLRPFGDGGELARIAHRFHGVPIVDTLYGSAVLMPMADGAEYQIWLGQNGLIARAANAQATQAVGQWR
jgi:hypothetical protein